MYRKIQERRILKRMAKSGIRYIDKMDGHQFEVYLKALFRELGYSPTVTKQSNDFGADLVLKGKNRIVIQAKELAEACHVKLIDRVELQKLINKINSEYSAEDVYQGGKTCRTEMSHM